MEVLTQKNGAKVFIDYAHNGDSLKKLISVVETHQTGKIALVLGSTGNKGRKAVVRTFGLLLDQHPEIQVFLTADDPNYEDPMAIADEISSYIHHPVEKIVDREQAIKAAMAITSQAEDAVITLVKELTATKSSKVRKKTILEMLLLQNVIYSIFKEG